MQKSLDHHIESKHDLKYESLLDRKFLAFQVELAELANETRCFKFWSEKPSSDKDVILEEYVDGVHFLLSIGIEYGFETESVYTYPEVKAVEKEGLVYAFFEVTNALAELRHDSTFQAYKAFFQSYLRLGGSLGFQEDEILDAYLKKNEVNYQRQENGY